MCPSSVPAQKGLAMVAEFISSEDPRWSRFLARHWHDFYHFPKYVRLCARHEGSIPVAFYAESQGASFLAPLTVRQLPSNLNVGRGWSDSVSPYGYSSPLVAPTQTLLPTFLEAFLGAAREHRIVSVFFRLHPFSELNKEDLGRFGKIVHQGQTVYIDLSLPDETFWSQVRRNHKQNIQRLKEMNFRVTLDDWSLLPDFTELYRQTMSRVGATTCLYDQEYFDDLRTILDESMHLCCVLSREGHVVAGGVFVETHGIVHYHLSATADEYLRLGPNKLIIPYMRAWAKAQQHKILHIGGGVGGAVDSLFHFKAGFSDARADFYTYRMIVDQSLYEALTRASNVRTSDRANIANYFPAYRHANAEPAPEESPCPTDEPSSDMELRTE
ncbi:MAG TPA: GNAT family N-acetyltransferase [Nitrospira sp.]|nr:GNAT family N-acetyltransferase [Nitrospira sp.]